MLAAVMSCSWGGNCGVRAWQKMMAAYCRVYNSSDPRADCLESDWY